jgi:hypothetical protein
MLHDRGGAKVTEQLSLLETPPPVGTAAVWRALDAEQRAFVVSVLVRLMAKAVALDGEPNAADPEVSLD